MLTLRITLYPFLWIVVRYKWLAKSCRPLSMPEYDKPFRAWIKQITYGLYTPLVESTVHSVLCNLHAETGTTARKRIVEYQVRSCSPYQLNSTALVLREGPSACTDLMARCQILGKSGTVPYRSVELVN